MSVEHRQMPLILQHEPGFTRDDLVVTGSNRAAVDLIDRWPEWPSPVAMLVGPAGAGKTHLAAIWRSQNDAEILDPRDINEQALEIAAQRPVLIDDIGAEPFDETGLFHLINTVRQTAGSSAKGQSQASLLMTSQLQPLQWNITLPDLISRLKAVTIVDISEPDDYLLSTVIYKLFADRQVSVDPAVISYIVSRVERSLDSVIVLVDLLDHMALQQKIRITKALATQALQAMAHALPAAKTDV
ncbi:DnaA regulatory inactivator HdaA [Pseudochrobactrum sp. MP213Fo]|uniref:DnaA regulatory inactivator HdaA n=1 Tax=Pseudochrobactrum sp. MP213Fo TaxID=3022250 RepID=UPI003BA20905